MKVHFFDVNNMVIYLNDFHTKELDITNKKVLEPYFKLLFLKLYQIYQIEMHGYFNIVIYHDTNYGAIIELRKEDSDYYEYYDSSIDMKIIIDKESLFLYEIEDIFEIDEQLLKDSQVYHYNNKFYLKLLEKIDHISLGQLLEYAKIVYKNTHNIIICGKEIQFS